MCLQERRENHLRVALHAYVDYKGGVLPLNALGREPRLKAMLNGVAASFSKFLARYPSTFYVQREPDSIEHVWILGRPLKRARTEQRSAASGAHQ